MKTDKSVDKYLLDKYTKKYGKYFDSNMIGPRVSKMNTDRKYWLIGDYYYPIPTFKEKITLGWKLASEPVKACIIVGSALVIATAVTVPVCIALCTPKSFAVELSSGSNLELTNKFASKNAKYKTGLVLTNGADCYPKSEDFHVYIDNKELPVFNYAYQNNGNTASLTIDAQYVTGTISIKATAKTIGFYNTPWSDITKILDNGGVNALKKHFGVDSFVGMHHVANVDNKDTDVVVIGERQDSIAGEYRNSTSLTFAFTDLDTLNIRTNYNASPFGDDEYSFTNSLLRTESAKLYDRITDSNLLSAIKPVNKSTADYYKSKDKQLEKQANYSYEITNDQIFPLSLKEMGGFTSSTIVNGKDDSSKVSVLNATDLEFAYDCENNCYELFKNNNAISEFKSDYNIWTRTPCLSNNHTAFKIDNTKEAHASRFQMGEITTEVLNYIPAFAIGEETSFESDAWENVVSYANEGFDRLQEVYGLKTFVGREKKIEIGGEIFRVRVIGENHDILSYTDNKEAAALTFEFTRAIDGIYANMQPVDYKQTNNWANSYVRNTLNNDFIKKLPDCLKDANKGIRTVDKYSSEYYTSSRHAESGVSKTNDKLFILSRKEIGAADWKSTKKDYEGESFILQRDPFSVEGDVYQYYLNEYAKYPNQNYSKAKVARIKGFGYQSDKYTPYSSQQYLLRSYDPSETRNVYFVQGDGSIVSEVNTTSTPMFPCFCIGRSNTASFEFDSWENVISNINKGEEQLVKAYGLTSINDFIGKQRYINIKKGEENEEYRVRVIGVNHDTLASDNKSKALLTFEFIRCIRNEVKYSEATSNTWSISDLRYLCNNELFNSLPDTVKNSIKPVTKLTHREDTGANEITTEKLFPLSAAEIGTEAYTNDGTTYDFYNITTGTYLNAERIKGGASYETYFLRSAYNESGTIPLVYSISKDGALVDAAYKYSIGVAPAFAI